MTQIGRGNFFQGSQSQFVSNNNFWNNGATHGGGHILPYIQPGFCGPGCYEPSVANTAINNGTVVALGVLGLILLRGLSRGGGHDSGVPSNSIVLGRRNRNFEINTKEGQALNVSADKNNKNFTINRMG